MNLKLNLKVLAMILKDFQDMEMKVSVMKNEELKKKLLDEILEKGAAARLLYDHYKAALEYSQRRS